MASTTQLRLYEHPRIHGLRRTQERKKLAFEKASEYTSDNPEWRDAYLEGLVQLVKRDKNHPSVIIWSLGNEAFYGQNHKAMLQGGFDWEWANHGLWIEATKPGETGYYAYGGDFGDFPNDGDFTLSGQTFALTFSRVTGNLTIWFVNGHSLLERDPTTKAALSVGCWRPPTNNDVPFDLAEWCQLGIDSLTNQLRYLETVRLPDGTMQVNSKAFICALILAWGLPGYFRLHSLEGRNAQCVHTPHARGFSTQDTTPNRPIADALDNATRWVSKANTAQLHTPYEVPEENDNRLDTRWLRMADRRGWGLKMNRIEATSKGNN
ncbi:glycosyl hydrolases family 2, TIM barrel domain-containing protein [Lipomyces doorenjongii]